MNPFENDESKSEIQNIMANQTKTRHMIPLNQSVIAQIKDHQKINSQTSTQPRPPPPPPPPLSRTTMPTPTTTALKQTQTQIQTETQESQILPCSDAIALTH